MTPGQIDDADVTLPDLWATHAEYAPDKVAVACGTVRRTWRDFEAGMNQVANALLQRGIAKGSNVAVLMGTSVETLEVIFGIVKSGACVVPLSSLLTGDQVLHLMRDADCRAAFVSADLRDRIEEGRGGVATVGRGLWIAHGFTGAGWTPLPELVDGASPARPPVRYAQTDPFNIIYSSGTTGVPKGILQTHRARLHWSFSNAIEMGFSSDTRALTTTALSSNGTWLMVLPALFAGGTVHALDAFSPDAFLDTVVRERITHTFMVPVQYMAVLGAPGLPQADLSSLRTMLCAGSPLRRDVKREVLARLGAGLYELYGYSEGFATMLKPGQHEAKFDSVGTPVLGFEMRILDDEGRELPRGTPGEIAGYGAGMMAGYYKRAEETEKLIWRDERGRTFLRSGDIGVLDADGYLTLVDRKKDMIISGGLNVFPTDIEAVVAQHPDVVDVAVVGIPDDRWGETALALVIGRRGAGIDVEAIRDFANARLARHQRIARVELRAEFPRNALGKVLKRQLRDEIARLR